MANPYSPSFRPILSNPLASALNGLASGALTAYELHRQAGLDKAAAADRQQQLANQGAELELRRAEAGYVPKGSLVQSASSSAGRLVAPGVLPVPGESTSMTGVGDSLPTREVETPYYDFNRSFAAQGNVQRAGLQQAAADAAFGRQQATNEAMYGNVRFDPGTSTYSGAAGPRNAAAVAAEMNRARLIGPTIANLTSEVKNRAINTGYAGQRVQQGAQRLLMEQQEARARMAQINAGLAAKQTPAEVRRSGFLSRYYTNNPDATSDEAGNALRSYEKILSQFGIDPLTAPATEPDTTEEP